MGTEIRVTVGDLRGKMQLTGKGYAGHEVQFDMTVPFGDDNGFTGLWAMLRNDVAVPWKYSIS